MDNPVSALRSLFDREWYLEQNPEVEAAGMDPLVHYLQFGGFEGRDPNPLFDSDWYLQKYPDAALTGLNPLVHYLRHGAAEGLDPHPLFDTDWYVKHTPDLPVGINPLIHYVAVGAMQGRPRFRDIEVVCIDDGSNDGSQDILEAYHAKDERIVIARLPHSSGAAIARNVGINCARGAYLQFTDADDVLPATAIEVLYSTTMSDGVELVRGNLASLSDSGGAPHQTTRLTRHEKADWSTDSELSIPWWHTTYLISRELVVENEISYPDLIDGEDPVFVASLLVSTRRIATIREVVYLWRKGGHRRRRSLRHIIDFIRHIPAVRRLYMQSKPEAWESGYYPFLCSRFKGDLLRNRRRTRLELAVIRLALEQAGLSQLAADLGSAPSAVM